MKDRSIKELLEVMLYNVHLFDCGLCYWTSSLWVENKITYSELKLLKKYISNNKPFNFRSITGWGYYWKPYKIQPRIDWINKHIKKNSI